MKFSTVKKMMKAQTHHHYDEDDGNGNDYEDKDVLHHLKFKMKRFVTANMMMTKKFKI